MSAYHVLGPAPGAGEVSRPGKIPCRHRAGLSVDELDHKHMNNREMLAKGYRVSAVENEQALE